LDQARRSPGPSLVRVYEVTKDRETKVLRRDPDEILCKGAAAGEDEKGIVHHFTPGLRFRGFIEGNSDPDRVVLRTRGSLLLNIPGADDAKHRGAVVYVSGANRFSLVVEAGSEEAGRIRYVRGNSALAFRATGDERPLDLNVATR